MTIIMFTLIGNEHDLEGTRGQIHVSLTHFLKFIKITHFKLNNRLKITTKTS
jgi:hypothetical protein